MSIIHATIIVSLANNLPEKPEYRNTLLNFSTEARFAVRPLIGENLSLRELNGNEIRIYEITIYEKSAHQLSTLVLMCTPKHSGATTAEELLKIFTSDRRWTLEK